LPLRYFNQYFLFNSSLSQADSTEITKFLAPAEYCFPQTPLRGGFDKIILDHHRDHFSGRSFQDPVVEKWFFLVRD
jgi:hypothetical protein